MKSLEELAVALMAKGGAASASGKPASAERDLVRRLLTRRPKEKADADLGAVSTAAPIDTGDLSRSLARARMALLQKKPAEAPEGSLAELMAD